MIIRSIRAKNPLTAFLAKTLNPFETHPNDTGVFHFGQARFVIGDSAPQKRIDLTEVVWKYCATYANYGNIAS